MLPVFCTSTIYQSNKRCKLVSNIHFIDMETVIQLFILEPIKYQTVQNTKKSEY